MEHIEGLSYKTLDEALLQLGFQSSETERARLYSHTESGAIIAFPIVDLAHSTRRNHLSAAASTLEMFGILDQYDFYLLLLRLSPMKVAV